MVPMVNLNVQNTELPNAVMLPNLLALSLACTQNSLLQYSLLQYTYIQLADVTHDTFSSPTHITQRFKGALLLETVIDAFSLSILDVYISADGFDMHSHALSVNVQACLISLISHRQPTNGKSL